MTSEAGEMAGQAVIVTGGAKGLGLAIAELLAARGAALGLVDIDRSSLSDAVARLAGAPRVHAIEGDIRRQGGARAAFEEAAHRLGRVDILINNAGMYPRTPILEIDDPTWDLVFDTNLRSMFHMTVAAAQHMKPNQNGRIVAIASIDAYIPYAKNAHYAAAKAGVVSLTRSFAEELAPHGILVNAVAPGPIDTPNLRRLGIYEDLARKVPLGRVAAPADIAEVVCFLAGPRNRYMTGETVIASGGILMT